jgi:type IV secretion system protein VirB1
MFTGAELLLLAQQCAPLVEPRTVAAIVARESGGNPFAIGVVGGRLARQPATRAEALATAERLRGDGWTFAVGVAQINVKNLPALGLTLERAFDACESLRAMQVVLHDCWGRAERAAPANPVGAIRATLSCYYSGNFTTGQTSGYVDGVLAALRQPDRNGYHK